MRLASHRPAYVAIVLVFVVLALFWRVTDHGFVWDDGINVERNDYLRPVTVANVIYFWQSPHEGLYVPLTYTAWAAIAYFSQLPAEKDGPIKLDPRLFHTANLIVHALNAVIIFAILRKLVMSDIAAAAGALLFALHPVQVEAVAWVTGLKDVLSGFFSFVAVWQYLAWAAGKGASNLADVKASSDKSASEWRGSNIRYGIATAAFVLALLAKPAAVVTPLMAWVLDCCVLKRSLKRSALSVSPWFAIALPFVVLTKLQQPDTLLDVVTPLWARSFVAADALAFYLYKLMVPLSLGPGYGRSPQFILESGSAYLTWVVPLSLGAVVWYWRRQSWLLAAVGVFVAALLPVLGIVQFQFQNFTTVADRYLYLSMLGPALAWAWMIAQPWKHAKGVAIAGAAVLLLLGVKSAVQAEIWRNSETLWRYTLDLGQESPLARSNLGATLVDSKVDEAIHHLRRAVALAPQFPDARYNLGIALVRRGDLQAAIDQFRYLLKFKPTFPNGHYALAAALADTGQLDEAIYHYREALQQNGADASAHNRLGNALADRGRLDEAIAEYREAIRLRPSYAGAYFNLGIALADRGDLEEAARQYQNTLQLEPDHANAHNNLAVILARQGRREEAIDHFRQALRSKPDFPEAQRGLAKLLGRTSADEVKHK